jgi:WD40 repeat protein
MCLSWSPEGDMLLTASTDKTCKIWNVVSGAEVCQFLMGSSIEDQQLGCLWQGETLISVALGGWINYLDRNNPSTPKRMLYGHMKNISGLCLGKNGSTFYSACQGGLICVWNIDTAVATIFKGPKHKTAVCDVLICENKIVSADQNRIICFSPADGDGSACVSLECSSTPVSMDCKGGTIGLACVSHIDIYREGKKQHSVSVSYSPASAAVHPNGETIAIGGKDQKIHVYHLKDGQLAETRTISLYGEVTTLKYSSDGRYLASGDSSSYVCLLPTDTYEVKDNRWTNHTTKITCLDWSPDSRCLVTGGVDCQVIVWSLENPKRPVMVPRAHTDNVTKVVFVDERTVLTAGYDCAIKLWDIKNTSTL